MAASMGNTLRSLLTRQIQSNTHNARMMTAVTSHQTMLDDSLRDLKTFKSHPGLVRPKQVKLPEALQQNVSKFLADKHVKQLQPRATALGNYLWSRGQPFEESSLRSKAREYAIQEGIEDLDEEMLQNADLAKENKKKVDSVMKLLKKHVYHWQPITYDELTVWAYLMARVAPNYAAIYRVFHEIRQRNPDFNPQTLLDFGSGIGTTTWAAHALWADSVKEFYCVDTSRLMHDVAEALMKAGVPEDEETSPLIKGVYFRHFMPMAPEKMYDLTVSAYSLLELPSKTDRLNTLRTLWRKTQHFMILIESGTNQGYRTVLEARDFILKLSEEEKEEENCEQSGQIDRTVAESFERDAVDDGPSGYKDSTPMTGHVFAPCQHDLACPRISDGSLTPCNFEQNFPVFTTRGQSSELTTERFCYLVLKKGPRLSDQGSDWPRIVRPVLPRSRHVVCRLCCPDGQLKEMIITRSKHGRELYRCARHSKWGDRLPISTQQYNLSLEEELQSEEANSETDHEL